MLRLCDGKGPAMPGWCTAAAEIAGPEFEVMCGGINSKQPTHAGLWRQGNLLHFGFEPQPSEFNPTGRNLLVNAIAYIARFTTDRPLVRERSTSDPLGHGPSRFWLEFMLTSPKAKTEDLAGLFAPPWNEQLTKLDLEPARAFVTERLGALQVEGHRYTFDADALAFGVDVRNPGALEQLAKRLHGEGAERARALLLRLLPEGPGADTTPDNWTYWLNAREAALCFDPHSLVWRIDAVAYSRGATSGALAGPLRADGDAVRDPAAATLAKKIADHHGGARALEDLQTFACRLGDVRCFWDRRAGIFRAENGGTIPAGNFATPWKVAILDTAAEKDIPCGGGPEPRPFVSAAGTFREVQELFLPLSLLEPGTSLRMLPDDAEGRRCLEVRLAGRLRSPLMVHVLHVDPQSGALLALDRRDREGAHVTWTAEGTIELGPLHLPSRFVQQGTTRTIPVEFADATWNPPAPAALATATELVLGGK